MLAVDLGAASGRAVIGRFDGETLGTEWVARFPNQSVRLGDTLYWDFLRLFEDVLDSLRRAGQIASITSVGVDAWGVDFGLLDRSGRLLGNPVHYRDGRTDGMVAAARRIVSPEELFGRTGIQTLPINTIYQLLAIVRSGDATLRAAAHLLMIPDLFHFFLCGAASTEYTNATTTQCLDISTRAWATDVLERLGIPAVVFPPIVDPGCSLGAVRTEVAETTGLGRVEVIAPATHDTGSAVAAVPAVDDVSWAYISSGTWSLVGLETRAPRLGTDAFAFNLTNEGGVGGRIRLHKNVTGLWLLEESRRHWASSGGDYTYAQLVDLARGAEPLCRFIDPDDPRFLPPGDMPSRIHAFCLERGQPAPTTAGEVVRTLLESLALKTGWVLTQISRIAGVRPAVVHLIGGGASNDLLCQLTADAAGLPVLAGPAEATAIGNLMVQAIARHELASLEEGRQLIRRSFPVRAYEPSRDLARWDEARRRFEALLAPASPVEHH